MKHTDLTKSDDSAESENEDATSDDLSDSNTGNGSKGMKCGGIRLLKRYVGMHCFSSFVHFFIQLFLSSFFPDQAL